MERFNESLLSFSLRSSADTHSLQFLYTAVTSGIHFPEFTAVGLLDGEQVLYYDSNIRKMIPKTEWMKKISVDDPDYWNREMEKQQDEQNTFKSYLSYVMQSFNQTEGVHTLQRMYGCELHDDGTTRGYFLDGYNGEDFIGLDLNTGTWTADEPQAEIIKKVWESTGHEVIYWKNYLERDCIDCIKKFVSNVRERKVLFLPLCVSAVPPTASVIQKHSPSPEVVCHATGFFPKEVMISWRKDGEDVNEDVELRETLPNQDGSFQKRSILKVPAEDLQKHTYTCVIQHSSLKEELVLEVPKGGGLMPIIVGVLVALVVLVAVVAGIMVWKKKNSGFRPVPPEPYPPTASVIQKHSPSPEVVCHATGFFPKAVNIFWRKDGRLVYKNVEFRNTLPNQDGSFQKRSILKVPAEDLQKHTYTCVIQHSSLMGKLVLEVPKGGGLMPIIVGVLVALVDLVAVVAGIMVWKKKNSDPPTASVIQKHSPSPEVVCHATGFFPKAVNIFWRKDGRLVYKNVEFRDTLPNQDGSFQKRSILKVPAEDLQKHTYTCVIQHSSLKEELVLEASNLLHPLKENLPPTSLTDVTVCLPAEVRERDQEMEMRTGFKFAQKHSGAYGGRDNAVSDI
ncbi:hypothetical protein KOW79_018402 [Hemibagrus wyckioides]|uniref:Ig-like domain-containing protein n=1 Tax=Hemibagrus wyckioides TaxID=337641 RepID=A0A9D3ND14_9TELE|nr:hypothetical protein KOW79_018402 [Hemibagrus wyckioides]